MAEAIRIDQDFIDANYDIPDTLGGDPANVSAQPAESALPSEMLTVEALEAALETLFDLAAMIAGEGGEFWQLNERQKRNLAKLWFPIVGPMLDRMGVSKYGAWAMAFTATALVVVPRVNKQKDLSAKKTKGKVIPFPEPISERQHVPITSNPESTTATTATEKSGASPSSRDLRGVVRAMPPIVS